MCFQQDKEIFKTDDSKYAESDGQTYDIPKEDTDNSHDLGDIADIEDQITEIFDSINCGKYDI